jgi:hypothetical protein
LLWALVRFIPPPARDTYTDRYQFWVLGLFGAILLAVLASFLWYNLENLSNTRAAISSGAAADQHLCGPGLARS